jgi:type I site-specific restriction endonuclease
MNEAETRAELIDPKLLDNGWGVTEGSKVLRERNVCKITDGRIQVGGGRKKTLIADYVLVYKGIKLAVVEAKSDELEVGEGLAQAKLYAEKLKLDYTYSTKGKEIYQIWSAMLANLLITLIKSCVKRKWVFSNLVSLIRQQLMNCINVYDFLEDTEGSWKKIIKENKMKYQNSLFLEIRGLTFENQKYSNCLRR